jgi:hypothetical protein
MFNQALISAHITNCFTAQRRSPDGALAKSGVLFCRDPGLRHHRARIRAIRWFHPGYGAASLPANPAGAAIPGAACGLISLGNFLARDLLLSDPGLLA